MKNNFVIMLTFLLILLSFFASTTYTGDFLRELQSGILSEGGASDPDTYYTKSSALTSIPVLYSAQRIHAHFEEHYDEIFADGVGDLNDDTFIDNEDCRLLQLLYGQNARRSITRLPPERRFASQQVYDSRGDINRDGIIDFSGDVRPFCAYVHNIGASSPIREQQNQQRNCAEEGATHCSGYGNLMECQRDAYGTLMFVKIQKPSFYARCIGGAGAAYYEIVRPRSFPVS